MSTIVIVSHPEDRLITDRVINQLVLRFGNAIAVNPLAMPLPGRDPVAEAIVPAQLVVVLISPRWFSSAPTDASAWFANPAHPLTRTLTIAYQQRKQIVPVLVGGAVFPAAQRLPAIAQPLMQINASQVRDGPDFIDDMNRLILSVTRLSGVNPTYNTLLSSARRYPQLKPIYLSYDPDDVGGIAGRLIDFLSIVFGGANLIHDLAANAPGAILGQEIDRRMRESSLAVTLIGPHWVERMRQPATPATQTLALEIETATRVGTPLVPVLVADAPRLDAAMLPPPLQPLAAIEPAYIRPAGFFASDMQALSIALSPRLRSLPLTRQRGGWRRLIVGVIFLVLLAFGSYSLAQVFRGSSQNYYPQLKSVVMVSPDEGWAVGDGGVVLHYVKGKWTVSSTNFKDDMRGITVAPDQTIWAVGNYGTLAHYANGEWKTLSNPASQVDGSEAIAAPAANSIWFVGNAVAHYSNGQLTSRTIALDLSIQLNSLAFVASDEGWAVGSQGLIFHYKQGTWTSLPSPTAFALNGVAVSPGGDAWAVGDGGTLLHEVSGAWTPVVSGITADLYGIALSADGSTGWIVGSGGTILHLDHGNWLVTKSVGTTDLHSVAVTSDGEAWAVGDAVVAHEINAVWTATKPPPSS